MASPLSSFDEAPPEPASLLGLAVETRSEILKHLVGGVILHVSSNRTRRPAKLHTINEWSPTYSYFICSDVKADRSMIKDKGAVGCHHTPSRYACEYKNSDRNWDTFSRERDDRKARRYFHKAIARTNRQMHEESLWAFFEYNTFSFCEPVAWQQFRDDHTAAQLNHMRAIELFTMTPDLDAENGYGEGDPYARIPEDRYWKFNGVGILKNVTKIVLGLRHSHKTYNGMLSQTIETIGQALDSAFGDLDGLRRLDERKVFIIVDRLRTLQGAPVGEEETEEIMSRLSVLATNLEAKLLALNPRNVAPLVQQGETQPQD